MKQTEPLHQLTFALNYLIIMGIDMIYCNILHKLSVDHTAVKSVWAQPHRASLMEIITFILAQQMTGRFFYQK